MNSSPLSATLASVTGVLAIEVLLVALVLALAERLSGSSAWRRAFARVAIVTVLLLTLGELSGAGRLLAARIRLALSTSAEQGPNPPAEALSERSDAESADPVPPLTSSFRALVTSRLAAGRPVRSFADNSEADTSAARAYANDPPAGLDSPIQPDSILVLCAGLIWAVGFLLVIARAGCSRMLLILLRLRCGPAANEALSQRVQCLARHLGIQYRIRVIESKRLECPIAFGWLQPTIGLPTRFFTKFAPAKQEPMLLHELAHLAGHDPAWCLLADVATALLWWHPAVWWLRGRLHIAGELAADEASLLVADGPAALAECLLELGARLVRRPRLGQLQITGFRSHLGCRVQRLMRLKAPGAFAARVMPVALTQLCAPFAVTLSLILCTAWATPGQFLKGDYMLNLKRSWKQSLAAVALLTGAGAPVQPAVAASASAPETTPASTSEAAPPETAPGPQAKPAPPTNEQLYRRYGLRTPAAAPAADPAQEAFMRRYGLRPGSSLPTEKPGARLEAKLRQIVLPTLTFDGMPLTEVLKNLDDQSRKLDPDKAGVNFLINRNFPPSAFSPRIDPTSGLPVPAAPEAIDMSVVAISIPMPLRNISLKDALDAITKVADRPIEYSIEDYAVVFSPKPEAQAEGAFARREPPAPAQLVVRTFKVDTNTFAAGLENAFGIKFELPAAARAADRSRVIQRALRDLLTQLAVSMDNSKTVFYNELTGVIMVRATPDDLEVVRAAIETLGGSEYQAGAYAQANGFGGGPGPALRPGETRP